MLSTVANIGCRSRLGIIAGAGKRLLSRDDDPDYKHFTILPYLKPENPDLVVGPWPRTEEERIRAAKKYNLIPEDYKPHEEGYCLGDYPDLPNIGQYNRDNYDDYITERMRRHYGEPYHIHQDLYVYERIDPQEHLKPHWVPAWKKFLMFIGPLTGLSLFMYAYHHFNLHINQNVKHKELGDTHLFVDYFDHSKNNWYEFPEGETMRHVIHEHH